MDKWNNFLTTIQDDEIKELFIEIADSYLDFKILSNHYYEMLNAINSLSYNDIAKDNYMKISLFSDPCTMVLKIKDEDFLSVLELYWVHFLKRSSENNYLSLINILTCKYPNRFKIC